MAELTALVGKRGSIKGSITRLEKCIDELDNDVTVSILKSRLKFLEKLYSKYDDVQLSLDIKDANEYSSDRKLIENKFLSLRDRIGNMIEISSVSNLNDTMHEFWQVEELSGKNLLSDEERECEDRYVKSVSRDDTGRYLIDLPLIEEK
ncbi:hypothetical protein NQ314_003472, partial [Rhamnusium bicolor]